MQHSAEMELCRISRLVEMKKEKKSYTSKGRGLLKYSFPPPHPPLGLLQSYIEGKATHHISIKMKHILLQKKTQG